MVKFTGLPICAMFLEIPHLCHQSSRTHSYDSEEHHLRQFSGVFLVSLKAGMVIIFIPQKLEKATTQALFLSFLR